MHRSHFLARQISNICLALVATTVSAAALADGPPQRIIVKYRANAETSRSLSTSRALMADASARLGISMSEVRKTSSGAQVMRISNSLVPAQMKQLIQDMSTDPNVEYVEEDRLMHAMATPNDSYYNLQWHYYEATGGLRLPGTWDYTTGANIRVAVIDTGARPHTDLVANLVGGADFISDPFISRDGDGRDGNALDQGDWTTGDDCGVVANSSWHGTHVAGTVAAATNNAVGVAGVAYNSRVVPIRVLGRCGGYTSDIADAIAWSSGASVPGAPANPNPARVANLSLGGTGACDATTQSAINAARARGTVVVVAAGNDNTDARNTSPANCNGVITVAATNRGGGRAYYSNFGANVDIAAPGGDVRANSANGVLSTWNTGTTTPGSDTYAYFQGTSQATPHVAGTVALMLSLNPNLTPDQVEAILKSTARPFPSTCNQCGSGIVDAFAASEAAFNAR
jgi:serine protease